MEKLPVNPSCELAGTKYCHTLNMGSCERCTIRASAGGDMAGIRSDIDLYETLLPEGGVTRLFTDAACALCKEEPRGERTGYAILDMAHPEPKRVQKWLLGKKVSAFGTMIPVQMSVCSKCRRTLLCIEYLPVAVTVVLGFAGLMLLGNGPVADALSGISPILPFCAWAALIVAAWLAGGAAANKWLKRADSRMYAHVLEQPVLAEMVRKGWKPVAGTRTKVFFSKSRIARGLGTAPEAFTERIDSAESVQNGQNS